MGLFYSIQPLQIFTLCTPPRVPSAALTSRYLSITSRHNWCTCWSTTPTTWERMATGHATALLWDRKAWASALARSQLCTRDLSGRRARRMGGVTRRHHLWLKETKLEQTKWGEYNQGPGQAGVGRAATGVCRTLQECINPLMVRGHREIPVCGVNVWFSGSFRWLKVKHLVSQLWLH